MVDQSITSSWVDVGGNAPSHLRRPVQESIDESRGPSAPPMTESIERGLEESQQSVYPDIDNAPLHHSVMVPEGQPSPKRCVLSRFCACHFLRPLSFFLNLYKTVLESRIPLF